MANNETIFNNKLDFARHRRYEDFSMVPTKPYEMLFAEDALNITDDDLLVEDITPYTSEEIEFDTDFWPCNGYFFFIDTIPLSHFVLENLEMIHDIGFRIFKVDDDIALVINAYGINYDIEYFLPFYELLLGDSADEVFQNDYKR